MDDTSNLNVNFEYMSADFTPDSGIPVLRSEIAPVDLDTNYQSPLDMSEQDVFRFQADYEKVISSSVTIRDKFYRRDLDWMTNGTIFNGAIPAGPTSFGLIRSLLELDDRQALTGNQFEAIFSFDTGAVRHSLLTGLELARYADVFTLDVNLLPLVDLFGPVEPPGSEPIPLPGVGFAGDSRSIVVAPYVVDHIELGGHVNVLIGGRIDNINIDFKDEASARERNDTEFSPMVGILAAPNDELSIYGNFSRSFAPPSPRVIGELVPERGTQLEAGIKKRFGAMNAETTLAVYQLERNNIPIPDDTGFTQQTGNQRSRGFEIDFAAQPSSRSRAFCLVRVQRLRAHQLHRSRRRLGCAAGGRGFRSFGQRSGVRTETYSEFLAQPRLRLELGHRWRRALCEQSVHRRGQCVRARRCADVRRDDLLPHRCGPATTQREEFDRSRVLLARFRRHVRDSRSADLGFVLGSQRRRQDVSHQGLLRPQGRHYHRRRCDIDLFSQQSLRLSLPPESSFIR